MEHLNVIKQALPCSIARKIGPPPNALPFQKLEEVFGHCVVMTVATLTHTGIQIVFAKKHSLLMNCEPWS